jgi:outer membrane protein OmpA-like peptidoglycan-associated protein
MNRRSIACVVVAVVSSAVLAIAHASGLADYQGRWPELALKVDLAAPTGTEVEQGADLQIRASASQVADVTVALEDDQHRIRLHALKRPDGDQLVPGTEMLFPDLGYGETLYADLPVGRATLWLIASDGPLPGTQDSTGPSAVISSDALVSRLEAARANGSKVTTERIPIRVVNAAVKDFVSKDEFVSFYAIRTRSVTEADRGFRIGFKLNSAELDDWSRRQLDEVGQGMSDPQLAKYSFAIEGHTDDTGSADFNMDLSLRRAAAVQEYLVGKSRVKGTRLKVRGFGQTKPAASGNNEGARAQNRRVVIRRLDPSAAAQ